MPRKIEAQQDYDMALWHGVISFELMLIHPRKFRVTIAGKGVRSQYAHHDQLGWFHELQEPISNYRMQDQWCRNLS